MEINNITKQAVSFENAPALETEGNLAKAISMYDRLLKKAPTNLPILSRLMVLCRKMKDYSREITYIDKAIQVNELVYTQLKTKSLKVAALSKKLNTLLGHIDEKGKTLLLIPEVVKLKKRKEVAIKRMKK